MWTGYFGKIKSYQKNKGYRFISIARFNRFWKGEEYKKLAPPAEIIKIGDKELYTKLFYERILNKLDAAEVAKELGDNAVLLCYEKYDDCISNKTFCHRHIVAKWLKNSLGIDVKELNDNVEQLSLDI